MSVGSRFLDPAVLARLPNLELVARRLVDGMFVGYHKSPRFGYSVEFVDHRDYVAGDDLRTVDWKVWARKDKYYVKRFEMESQLRGTIVLDTSTSMDFGEGALTKLTYGSMLAASLAHLLIHQNDLAGLSTFDGKVRNHLAARGGRSHLRDLLHVLGQVKPGPGTDVATSCNHLAELIPPRGMVMVISDLLDDVDKVLHALRHLRHEKHDVIVFHLLDDAELDLPYQELLNLRDVETGQRLAVDANAFRGQYRERVGDFCQRIREGCIASNIDYQLIKPSQPLEEVLARFMNFRLRRAR